MKAALRERVGSQELGALQGRRVRLFQALGSVPSVLVVSSAPDAPAPYSMVSPYRNNQNLTYLSGCDEPSTVAVFVSCGTVQRCLLFKKERDLQFELWNGPMMSLQDAHESLGFDQVFPLADLDRELARYLSDAEVLYFESSGEEALDFRVQRAVEMSRSRRIGLEIRESRHVLASLRLIKDNVEVERLAEAGRVTSVGHTAAMTCAASWIRAGRSLHERTLQAAVEHAFRVEGAEGTGYPSIVASGSNACCLHYNVNRCAVDPADLVLIDAGAQVSGYTGDVTRTFPASGVFSAEQALVYDIVLDVQMACIERVKPGESHISLQNFAIRLMCERLVAAGLLDRSVDECMETDDYKRFYPHNLGHWLGRDVHDAGTARIGGRPVHFQPGHVITVEPGLYFQLYDERVPAAFRGIGVRIEDDVLVTASGCRNLTSVIKARGEIEALMASGVAV
jgi:Xaa-Pro aminopeptidase